MGKPTTGELEIMFTNLEKNSDEKHVEIMEVLKEIKRDTKETNGKIAEATIEIERLKTKNKWQLWALGILSTAFIIALPVFRSIVISEIRDAMSTSSKEIKDDLTLKIKNTFEQYSFEFQE